MMPKRFKAVCTETGREFWPEYQGLEEGPDMKAPTLKKHKGKIFHDWPLSIWLPREHTNKVELCQSTGLSDKKGREVYEASCLWWPSMRPGVWVIVEYLDGEYRGKLNDSGVWIQFTLKEMMDKDMIVIGNRWQPAAELRARAEAVNRE